MQVEGVAISDIPNFKNRRWNNIELDSIVQRHSRKLKCVAVVALCLYHWGADGFHFDGVLRWHDSSLFVASLQSTWVEAQDLRANFPALQSSCGAIASC